MICDILQTVQKYDMIKTGDTVVVGVSGGADSVCLIHFLSTIKEKYGIVLKAVHVNHNIRGNEAKRDENFVRAFCRKLGVELHVFSIDIPKLSKEQGISEEECGRNARYDSFRSVEANKIAVAHTLSDSAETVLFNLARGTALKGVCGIPPVRDNIIRPLIERTRSDIEHYCEENGLSYVTDTTNFSTDYTRNKIRHNVVTYLKEVNPSFEKAVMRFTQTASSENAFMHSCAEKLIEKAKTDDGCSRKIFLEADKAILRRAVALLLNKYMQKDVEERHIELCCDIINKGKGAVEVSKGLFIVCNSDIIKVQTQKADVTFEPFSIKAADGDVKVGEKTFEVSFKFTADASKEDMLCAVDVDNVDIESLYFRNRKSGDKFSDIRRKNTKTLKKLFCEKKIPPEERELIAVLAYGEEVLFVEGIGTDAKYVPNKDTKKVMVVKTKEGQ